MLPPFANEPFTDFTRDENRRAMEQGLARARSRFGEHGRLLLDGKWVARDDAFVSLDPSTKDRALGRYSKATPEDVERAFAAATRAFETWRHVPAAERAGYLLKAAAVMRRRKFELAATMVHEVGKNWAEADGDVAEAIDFCEFYAREALRWAEPQPLVHLPGEENGLSYIPLGVGAVIPPWNFPLAILVGMTTAALATGNCVLLKPASDSPAIGLRFAEILQEECRIPPGVFQFLSGSGSVVGERIVCDPRTRFIAFTGSMDVGLGIQEKAARTPKGQIWIKRTIMEMGGKDPIVVDSDADLDAAAAGAVAAAFGFQGQKCSACSRLVVVKDVHDELLSRVVERTKALRTGDPWDPATDVGPVINRAAFDTIHEYMKVGAKEGRVAAGGGPLDREGNFLLPTVVDGVAPRARLAQEEIFGPVLAVIAARDFEDALAIANDSIYGLTGAVYTRRRDRIEEAKRRFHVGNLYVNRKCTGALVGVHPFGGFNMSGTDSKAGGRDYLGLFLQAKVVSERF
ncbi:MAG: L-glutamate gamma-semialdehyde dehydrogenase [Planctomycetes bacterium]|nr:L-glutamate gamma-semialdehyde dehydrogenase [Planctomycetota bacterium]